MSSTKKRENDSDAEEQEETPKVSSSGSNKKAKTESSSSGEAVFSIGKIVSANYSFRQLHPDLMIAFLEL